MQFFSTRDQNRKVTSSEAIAQGLSNEGGLFVPESFPQVDVKALCELDYPAMAAAVIKEYLTDYSQDFLTEATRRTYGEAFGGKAGYLAPVEGDTYALELWHGPTCAFKDYALQLMPKLLVEAKKNLGRTEKTLILVATSGDTGKAALAGFADAAGTGITVFYPEGKVSQVQELQMTTQSGSNVNVCAVKGNFDDAQSAVKRIFGDKELAERLADDSHVVLSSANSINIGRLVPQIVYYVYAYAKLYANGVIGKDERINVVVPTGNFGNILAAYYAKQMGVPIDKLVCASNDNKVLFDFFQTGDYDRNREFILTTSPSMDILISSNLERLLYRISGDDDQKTKDMMEALKSTGKYTITEDMKARLDDFAAGYATEEECAQNIKKVYDKTGYVMDTHTSVASYVCECYQKNSGDNRKCVIASTASPYKFVKSVMSAIDPKYADQDEFSLLKVLEETSGREMPQAIKDILNANILHDLECDADKMKDTVKNILEV